MSLQKSQRALVFLVIFSLLLTTGAGGASANDLLIGDVSSAVPSLIADEEAAGGDEDEAEEDSGGGWFSNTVDSGKNIVGKAKDGVVDGAEAVWNVVVQAPGSIWNGARKAPGAIWNGIRLAPGAIWGKAQVAIGSVGRTVGGGWERVLEQLTKKVEVPWWPVFLENHPILGRVLGPVVWLLTGLSPHGTLSYFDIGFAVVALSIPVFKGGQAVTRRLLPWVDDAGSATNVVRRNPGGIISGARDMIRLRRATSIAPVAKNFSKLPDGQGVYVAMDVQGNPLYVGMSNSLTSRMRQHFGSFPSGFANRTDSIKILPASSSTEAKALECRLVKSLLPEFNVIYKNLRACPAFSAGYSVPASWLTLRFGWNT